MRKSDTRHHTPGTDYEWRFSCCQADRKAVDCTFGTANGVTARLSPGIVCGARAEPLGALTVTVVVDVDPPVAAVVVVVIVDILTAVGVL